MDQSYVSKFSMIDMDDTIPEADRKAYQELERFIYYLAWKSDEENILMGTEEIMGELLLELVKGMKAYPQLQGAQKQAVLRRMLDNRLGELNHRFYGTHRVEARFSISIESDIMGTAELVPCTDMTPEDIQASKERVEATRSRLLEIDQKVFDAVIFGDKRLDEVLRLNTIRTNHVKKNPHFNNPVTALRISQVAKALLLSENQIRESFSHIRLAYAEVCNE